MVVAADDMGDRHVMVVHHDGKIVGGRAVGAQDDEVVELLVRDRDGALHVVGDDGLAVARRLEADGRRAAFGRVLCIEIAAVPVIERGAALGARPLAHRFELGRAAIAAIGMARGDERLDRLGMARQSRRLQHDLAVPVELEP